ncbi:hypothetical protein K435DRAFT_847043 [Dendrothele bispora CBS 962.96]|uniref:Transcription factor domain-containing protein n=1 Tax=Dendrothele bispora (strain CBS 962.96) TaxID=1314807 RepID=A0A4S8MZG0_DENBC|nr:hypothetical protein K435DRAFT_847043 [Dendrothele bispora CBS 962.96]
MDRSIFEGLGKPADNSQARTAHSDSDNPVASASTNATPEDSVMAPNSFPPKPHTIWGFLRTPSGSLDWSAPLEAILELSKQANPPSPRNEIPPPPLDDSLESILTRPDIDRLLEIFSQKYVPWLGFTPIREQENPLLDLVCCTVASRDLDDVNRALIAPRLQTLTKDSCAKMIFQSSRRSESIEVIQCLLILSLWAPVCGFSADFQDGRTLIASAVSMALTCRLNEACDKVAGLLDTRSRGGDINEADLSSVLDRTRLWMSLANTESMLCIGNGRSALSKRSPKYLHIFTLSPKLPSDVVGGRDLRLRLLAELYDSTEQGMAIPFKSLSKEDVDAWYDGMAYIFSNLARIGRLILPLGVVTDFDAFYFYMLNIIIRSCRLLLLYHATYSARAYFHRTGNDNPFWFRDVRPRGLNIIISWGKESLQISESILVTLLEMDVHFLGTTPDHIFTMIAFAAGFLVGVKFLILQGVGVELPGSSEKLLNKSIAHLNHASCAPDSAARKCAKLISGMVAIWDEQVAQRAKAKAAAEAGGLAGAGVGMGRGMNMMPGGVPSSIPMSGLPYIPLDQAPPHTSSPHVPLGSPLTTSSPGTYADYYSSPAASATLSAGGSGSESAATLVNPGGIDSNLGGLSSVMGHQTHQQQQQQLSGMNAGMSMSFNWMNSELFQEAAFWNDMFQGGGFSGM